MLVPGCGSGDCGSGAESAPAAVRELLEAATGEGDESDICRYVPEGRVDDARQVVEELEPRISAGGGIEGLDFIEQSHRQMGSEYVVSVTGAAGFVRDFVVIHNSGRFLVYPTAQPASGG